MGNVSSSVQKAVHSPLATKNKVEPEDDVALRNIKKSDNFVSVLPNFNNKVAPAIVSIKQIEAELDIIFRTSEFPRIGIKLSYFPTFFDFCGGKDQLTNLTTSEVCQKFVIPITSSSKVSFTEYLFREKRDSKNIGIAKVFISHAWKYNFLEVYESMKNHFQKEPDIIVWFDLFTNSQHGTQDRKFEWWCNTFMSAVKEFGRTVMILAPWNDPITFTRAWCLFEIYSTLATKSRFEIALSPIQQDEFLKAIFSDGAEDTVKYILSTVDTKRSDSFLPKDKEQIFEAVQKTVGFGTVNGLIFERFRDWMLTTAQQFMPIGEEDKNSLLSIRRNVQVAVLMKTFGNLTESKQLLYRCYQLVDRRFLTNHAVQGPNSSPRKSLFFEKYSDFGTASAEWARVNHHDEILKEEIERSKLNPEEFQFLLQIDEQILEVLEQLEEGVTEICMTYIEKIKRYLHERNHELSLIGIFQLAKLLLMHHNDLTFDTAGMKVLDGMLHVALLESQKLFGINDLRSLEIRNVLALIGIYIENHHEAIQRCEACYSLYQTNYGVNHSSTVKSLEYLTFVYFYSLERNRDELISSLDLLNVRNYFSSLADKLKELYSLKHLSTLQACYRYAKFLYLIKDFQTSKEYCELVVDMLPNTIGMNHPFTKKVNELFGRILIALELYEEALLPLSDSVAYFSGKDRRKGKEIMTIISFAFEKLGNYQQAIACLEPCIEFDCHLRTAEDEGRLNLLKNLYLLVNNKKSAEDIEKRWNANDFGLPIPPERRPGWEIYVQQLFSNKEIELLNRMQREFSYFAPQSNWLIYEQEGNLVLQSNKQKKNHLRSKQKLGNYYFMSRSSDPRSVSYPESFQKPLQLTNSENTIPECLGTLVSVGNSWEIREYFLNEVDYLVFFHKSIDDSLSASIPVIYRSFCSDQSITNYFYDINRTGESLSLLESPNEYEESIGDEVYFQGQRWSIKCENGVLILQCCANNTSYRFYPPVNASRISEPWIFSPPKKFLTKSFANGLVYEGEVNAETGSRHGKGKLLTPTGDSYTGEWENDKIHGKGEFIWKGIGNYCGDWINGEMEGNGQYVDAKDGRILEGEFHDGQIHGKGKEVYEGKFHYHGSFCKGLKEGYGAGTWKDVGSYVGQWQNNKMHGQGHYIPVNGTPMKGNFVDGTFADS
jgi:tetratricopeptide (TPR) repeat protein